MAFIMGFLETVMYVAMGFFLFEFLLGLFKQPAVENEIVDSVEESNAISLCRVEQIEDTFYLYDVVTENFVGQAKTAKEFEEISDRIQKHVMIVDGDEKTIGNLKKVQGLI